jgi:hypothetical protein
MSESLSASVAALRDVGRSVTEVGAGLGAGDPGARAFGADGPGALGELGRELHRQWQRAFDARVREAAAHGARLDDLADRVARVLTGYADIDEGAARAQPEVP